MSDVECRTVGELIEALSQMPQDATISTLYDWGADVKRKPIIMRGVWTEDDGNYPRPGDVVLDIDPQPEVDA